ncbi:hypothetical protein FHS15_005703 [Paenibacillus castaneae]|nr:hypothetical protein [Paenibacillus castaneae]NIK80513.1 hypothetical protein [Paenibacillus castaneae]
MRGILVSMLLLITVLLLYQAIAEGGTGMKHNIHEAGVSVSGHIRGMSP